ncbi:DUF3631 domain-containing protein [Glaciibacter superstes]|uniref:DUF3631 domain-containing protein n=1 Tax=Glaciibacter superstes TaxID=501023 RepID=UPI0003B6BACD|nr:DUF3631 domain-containing protein [Glaciibacter superstes]
MNGAEVLDDIRKAIADYCVLPKSEDADAIALWTAVTHASGAFDFAPRLVIKSVEKRSGKTRVLEVVDGMSHEPIRLVNGSVSYLFRRVELAGDAPPTIFLDEADTLFGSPRQAEKNEDLRGLLNSGFQRGSSYGRVQGPTLQPKEFRTFAMVAIAGIGDMPDTIEDRAIVIRVKRRRHDESVKPFRSRDGQARLGALRVRLAEWLAPELEGLAEARPELPVIDRAADVWEPLAAVANLAGGEWPNRAWDAALKLTESQHGAEAESSFGGQLLADIRGVYTALNELRALPTAVLLHHLNALEESPWGGLNGVGLDARSLSRRLRPYGVRPGSIRVETEVVRGYKFGDLQDAWGRYLDSPTTTATSTTSPKFCVADQLA